MEYNDQMGNKSGTKNVIDVLWLSICCPIQFKLDYQSKKC